MVRDRHGSPIAGAELRVVDSSVARRCPDIFLGSTANLWVADHPTAGSEAPGQSRGVHSDSGGHFEISRPDSRPREGILLATASGLAPQLEKLAAGRRPEVILEEGNDLVIHLLAPQETAMEGASVTLVPLSLCGPLVERLGEVLVRRAMSDSEGRIELDHVADGIYALRLVAKGYRTANVAPLVVRDGRSEIRIRLAQGRHGGGSLDFPPHVAHSSGTILAFWKGPDGIPEWQEASFSGDDAAFAIDGLPSVESLRLLARTESGLSSRVVSGEEFTLPGGGNLSLRPPSSWRASLDEGVKIPALLVQPMGAALSPPGQPPQAVSVPVGADGHFVVQDVPPAAEKLQLVAPGFGEAEVGLAESASGELGSIKLERGPTLGGRVTWQDGEPLNSAEIEVFSSSGLECRGWVTNQGEFACSPRRKDPPSPRFRAWVGSATFRVTRPERKGEDPFVVLPGFPLEASVSRPGGGGKVEDARVEIEPIQSGGPGSRAEKKQILYSHSRHGDFTLHLGEPGPVKIMVSNPDGGPGASATVDLSNEEATRKIALTLPEGPAVFGSVAAAGSRKTIENAEVEIIPGTIFAAEVRVSRIAHSDSEGSWRFSQVSEGNYQLLGSAPGYSRSRSRVSVPAETRRTPQLLLLQRPGRIHGRAIGLPEGAKASVNVTSKSWWIGWNSYKAIPDEKGEFSIDAVRPDRYDVTLFVKKTPAAWMNRSLLVDVRAGETAETAFDLRGVITLSGRAYLGEKPVPRGKIGFSLDSKKTHSSSGDGSPTDEEGDYEVKLPRPGRYRVRLFTQQSLHGGGQSLQYDHLLAVGDVNEQRQDLHFSTARIRGRVVEAKSKPVTNAGVELDQAVQEGESSEAGEGDFQFLDGLETGQDGTFESEVLRAGEYHLEIGARGFARKTIGPVTLGHDQSLVLPDIALEPELSVCAVLLDPHGQPLSGSVVSAYADTAHLSEWGASSETSGDDGAVTLRGLSPGSYTLVGRSLGLPPAFLENVKVPPEEPASSLVIQFAQGGSLEVQVLNKSGAPVPDLTPILIDRQGRDVTEIYRNLADMTEPFFTDSEGRAWLASVLPGEYEVKAARGESSDSRQVTVSAGTVAKVVLVAPEE